MKPSHLILAMSLLAAAGSAEARDIMHPRTLNMSADQLKAESPRPDWLKNAVIYEANLRQGTSQRNFKGLQQELPRLRSLGVDVIWLMPIHPISKSDRKGTLGSYYAVSDYTAVNPEFGTMQDLVNLVKEAHKLGMKVILDEVCNHTGTDHRWVKEHPEYYARNEKGKMYGPYDWTDVYKLDYNNPDLRKEMTEALKFWIQEADIDGYRCDVAFEVPTDYWEEAREQLQRIKPVLMLAEASKPELLHKAFDLDYAWPMKDAFNAVAHGQGVNSYAAKNHPDAPKGNAAMIRKLAEEYPKKGVPYGGWHMNMVTNHDLNSWEGTEFDRYGEAANTFAVLSYTLPGVPMMYTGQEVGFNHAFEFFETDSIRPVYRQNEFTKFYKELNMLKHKNAALDAGNPIHFYNSGNENILVYDRVNLGKDEESSDMVVVIANLSNKPQPLRIPDKEFDVAGMKDYFQRTPVRIPKVLAPWQYLIIVK